MFILSYVFGLCFTFSCLICFHRTNIVCYCFENCFLLSFFGGFIRHDDSVNSNYWWSKSDLLMQRIFSLFYMSAQKVYALIEREREREPRPKKPIKNSSATSILMFL